MRFTRLLPLLCCCFLSGCATGVISIKMPISGGETVPLELGKGGFAHAQNDDAEVIKAYIQIDGQSKTGTYHVEFRVKNKEAPRNVKVDDVTDDTPQTLVDDPHPQLNKDGHWIWQSGPISLAPANLKWLYEIENTVRVYRFTIVTSDGRTLVMYEGFSYPAAIKAYVRKQLGIDDSKTPGGAGAAVPEPTPTPMPASPQQADQSVGLDPNAH